MPLGLWVNSQFSGEEVPYGVYNGVNTTFSLSHGIVNVNTLIISNNGITLTEGIDFEVSGITNQTITFTRPPLSTDIVLSWYQYGALISQGFFTVIPTGSINGYNILFTIPSIPNPATSLRVFYNGSLLTPNVGYTISNTTITTTFAPQNGDVICASYRLTAGALYHNPQFISADNCFNYSNLAITSTIDLGEISGDSLYYQFTAYDYEGDTVNYYLSNASSFPGNLSLNSNGWLSATINLDSAIPGTYTFDITAYKAVDSFYQTTIPVTLSVTTPLFSSLSWTGNVSYLPAIGSCGSLPSVISLGNVYVGSPCSISVNAGVTNNFNPPSPSGASANCTMALVGATIVSPGDNFFVGNTFSINTGIYNTPASITITSVNNNGNIITDTSNSGSIYGLGVTSGAGYSELPTQQIVWQNPNQNIGTRTPYNSIIDLSFGVDAVNVIERGQYYDVAFIGFGDAGQTLPAQAIATVTDQAVSSANVIYSGKDYTEIPPVIITGNPAPLSDNTVSYSIVSGYLPSGLTLFENGLIAGVPTSQSWSTESATLIDGGNTFFDKNYTFTIQATTSINRLQYNGTIEVDGPLTFTSTQEFTLNLKNPSNTSAPKSNLYLDLLLSESDYINIYAGLYNPTIVSNDIIFREGDSYFGIPNSLKMLVAYGVDIQNADIISMSMAKFHSNKRYLLNNLSWAQSTSEGYEVIFLVPTDQYTAYAGPQHTGFQSLTSSSINNSAEVTVDTAIYDVSITVLDSSAISTTNIFPPSTINMQGQLQDNLSAFDYNYLPSWMRDTQPNGQVLGFVPAIPLIYVKPGTGKKILYYLQNYYNSVLNTVYAVADRYLWNKSIVKNWNQSPTVSIVGNNSVQNIPGYYTSSFTVNTATINTVSSNLTPLSYNYTGNLSVYIPVVYNDGNIYPPSISNIVSAINSANIPGITGNVVSGGNIAIQNITGCPFYLYDGTNSPLENCGILPANVGSILVSNAVPAGWRTSEITIFDFYNAYSNLDTESGLDLLTEAGDNLVLDGSIMTFFGDAGAFFENSDIYIDNDTGGQYLVFPQTSLIAKPIISA